MSCLGSGLPPSAIHCVSVHSQALYATHWSKRGCKENQTFKYNLWEQVPLAKAKKKEKNKTKQNKTKRRKQRTINRSLQGDVGSAIKLYEHVCFNTALQ